MQNASLPSWSNYSGNKGAERGLEELRLGFGLEAAAGKASSLSPATA